MKNNQIKNFLLLIFAHAAAACGSGADGNANQTNQTKTAAAPAIKIEADDLMTEWQKDRAATETKYAGKRLEISGAAVGAGKSDDKAEIRLYTNAVGAVVCQTDSTAGTDKLSALINDKRVPSPPKITVTGTFAKASPNGNDIEIVPCEPPYPFQ